MIKVYGMPTCPDCAYVHVLCQGRWFSDRRAGESWTCVKTGR